MKNFSPLLLLLGLLFLFSCSKEAPPVDDYGECRVEISAMSIAQAHPLSGLIEGDIIPDIQNKAYIQGDHSKIWPNNTVAFYFDESLSEKKQYQILGAIAYIESTTYIKFESFPDEATLKQSHKNGIRFTAPINPFAGNSSHVGMQVVIQNLTLVESSTDYVISHEIYHALGHEHEHTRPDRDNHITVHYDNIPINPTLRRQFDKREGGIPCGKYDTKSGMHYGSFNGATNIAIENNLPAITTKDGELIPVPTQMSEGDIEVNKIIYPKIS